MEGAFQRLGDRTVDQPDSRGVRGRTGFSSRTRADSNAPRIPDPLVGRQQPLEIAANKIEGGKAAWPGQADRLIQPTLHGRCRRDGRNGAVAQCTFHENQGAGCGFPACSGGSRLSLPMANRFLPLRRPWLGPPVPIRPLPAFTFISGVPLVFIQTKRTWAPTAFLR